MPPWHGVHFFLCFPERKWPVWCCWDGKVTVKQKRTHLLWDKRRRIVGCSVRTANGLLPVTEPPAMSLGVFFLITHHSSCGKAPHKLQRIVPRLSACHHAAPRLRVALIVERGQSWRSSEGGEHTHMHIQNLSWHIHRLIWIDTHATKPLVCPHHTHTCTYGGQVH